MSRILSESFEAGHFLRFNLVTSTTIATSTTAGGPIPDGLSCAAIQSGPLRWAVPTPVSELYVGFFWSSQLASNEASLFTWYDTSLNELGRFRIEQTTGKMQLQVGGVTVATGTGILLNTTTYHFQLRLLIDNTTGVISVKRDDGTETLTFNGDTLPGAFGSTIGYIQWSAVGYSGNNTANLDSITVNNTSGGSDNSWPGVIRFQRLLPTGVGTYVNNWSRNTGSTNWEQVDDVPHDSDTTYLYTTTANLYESFSMGDHSLTNANYRALLTAAVVKKDSGTVQLAVGFRDDQNSTDYFVANSALTTSYGVVEGRQTTDPSTGTTWTSDGINSTQALIVSTTG